MSAFTSLIPSMQPGASLFVLFQRNAGDESPRVYEVSRPSHKPGRKPAPSNLRYLAFVHSEPGEKRQATYLGALWTGPKHKRGFTFSKGKKGRDFGDAMPRTFFGLVDGLHRPFSPVFTGGSLGEVYVKFAEWKRGEQKPKGSSHGTPKPGPVAEPEWDFADLDDDEEDEPPVPEVKPIPQDAPRAVACPHCGSPVGEPCRAPNGDLRPPHRKRVKAENATSNQPLRQSA